MPFKLYYKHRRFHITINIHPFHFHLIMNKYQNPDTADVDKYPGIAVNISDGCKKTDKLVKERTKTLNNNPRNNK